MGDRWLVLCGLADDNGYPSGQAAATELLGRPVLASADLSGEEIEDVIAELDEQRERSSQVDGKVGNPDLKWAVGSSVASGGGFMLAGAGSAAVWALLVFTGLMWLMVVLDWGEGMWDRARHPFG